MKRNEIGGFPYEAKKEGTTLILRLFPHLTAKFPDCPDKILKLNESDRKKLIELCSL
jgi:hypothetical protein